MFINKLFYQLMNGIVIILSIKYNLINGRECTIYNFFSQVTCIGDKKLLIKLFVLFKCYYPVIHITV